MRLKVCLIIPTLVKGGAEKQLALLAAGLDRTRFECHVIVLTHSGPYEAELRAQGIQVHVIGKRGKLDPSAYWRLARKLKELRPDVVHTWLFAGNSYGRMAAHRVKVPVIIAGERSVDPWKQWWNFAVDRYLLKYTDTIVTNTNAVVDFYAPHGIAARRFTVIANAVVPPQVTPLSREQVFERLKLPPKAALVGAVGRLWKQKGYRELVWSAELLRVALKDVCVVIIGDGPERDQLLHYRDQVGADEAARFVGEREDALQLMTGFDLLWNGSLYEGQSNTILEAMACGVPVVATDIPGTRDLVEHEVTGLLYPQGDVGRLTRITNQLLREPERRAAMGVAAKQRIAEQFSLQRMISQHEELYERLHRSKTRSPSPPSRP
ncbi:MAG: glycosyltransferase [Pirellulaceae bacterium]|nr:glycosyltransferase [Pirellulaceae bacterium]